jgi:hypothetical protein
MSILGHKLKTFQPTTADKIPEEWFLSFQDLNKPEIKNYMDEEYRKKAQQAMIINMVKEHKSNIRDYNDPQVRKEINEQTTAEQIKKAREYAKSNEKNI